MSPNALIDRGRSARASGARKAGDQGRNVVTIPNWKWPLIILGLIAGVGGVTGAYTFVNVRSRAILDERHAKPLSAVRAATTPEAIARGAALTTVTACAICHGDDLTGRMLSVSGSAVYAPNLTVLTRRLSDADIDRAIRRGLRPDSTSELAMPSQAYANFTDDEVASIIGYLRGLGPHGTMLAQTEPGLLLRANLLAGVFKTAVGRLADAKPPLDAGPRFALGRHLASLACGQCHGTDLGGGRGLPGPDLTVQGYYDRSQFLTLLRTGVAVDDGDMALMSRTARMSFSHFTDNEINAVFDYLEARDRILGAKQGRR
jgi:mono/diheme cytochrome c family protein